MQKYTIRPVFWLRKLNSKGLGPIMIVLTIDRKARFFKTGLQIKPQEWEENMVIDHANAALYNRTIRKKIAEIEDDLLSRTLSGEHVTSRNVKELRLVNVFAFIEEVKKNMPGATQRRYNCESNRLKKYAGNKLEFREITTQFLRNYERHERNRGQAQNTLNTTIRWLKAIMNKARKEGVLKELPIYETPKYVNPERIYLVEEERQVWMNYWREKKCDGSMYHTLTWFLFGCYSGLRHSDWKQFDYKKRVEGEFLKLRAQKNARWVVLPIGKTLAEIIEVVKGTPAPLSGDKMRAYLKILAGRIGCSRNITTHTARHTFGCLCAQLRLPKSTAAELMGISENVVNIYYHLTGVDIIEQASAMKEV